MAVDARQIAAGTDWRLHLGWGVGTLGASFLLNSVAALQSYYLTKVLGIGAAAAGVLLIIAKVWDVFTNPLMGMISDRTETRWGRRRPYLVLGGIVAGLSFALFFGSAANGTSGNIVLVVVLMILIGTGYTIFNVPYMAMPSEMEDNFQVRTRMMSYRVFFIGIGTFVGIATQRMSEWFGGGPQGYASMGMLIGFCIFFFMSLSFFGTAGSRVLARQREIVPFREQLRLGLENRHFAALLGTKFAQLFGLFTNTAMLIFVIEQVNGQEKPGTWLIYFTLCATLMQTLAIPFWTRITLRWEKQKTYMFATVLFCIGSLTWLFASPAEPLWIFCLRAAFKGFVAGGLILMGQSMLPDTIEYDYLRTGLRREGIFSGLYSTVEKVGATFAPGILLFWYAFFGFESKAAVQTQETIDGIRYCAAFLPCLYFGLSLIPLYYYRLTEQVLRETKRIGT